MTGAKEDNGMRKSHAGQRWRRTCTCTCRGWCGCWQVMFTRTCMHARTHTHTQQDKAYNKRTTVYMYPSHYSSSWTINQYYIVLLWYLDYHIVPTLLSCYTHIHKRLIYIVSPTTNLHNIEYCDAIVSISPNWLQPPRGGSSQRDKTADSPWGGRSSPASPSRPPARRSTACPCPPTALGSREVPVVGCSPTSTGSAWRNDGFWPRWLRYGPTARPYGITWQPVISLDTLGLHAHTCQRTGLQCTYRFVCTSLIPCPDY